MSNILLLNDFVSKGKVAGNMIEPILTYTGHQAFFLPTALISNGFSMGKIATLDTTSYIKDSLKVWDELGYDFDLIFIGFIDNKTQKELIIDYIKQKASNALVILDPIMGDNGSLYKGLNEEKIALYKDMLTFTDIVTPNLTEADLLGLTDYNKLIKDDKKYLITSVNDKDGYHNLGIDKDLHKTYFKNLDVDYAGTGDLMDGLFIIYYLESKDFNKAINQASLKMSQILKAQKDSQAESNEIMIESYLSLLDIGGRLA